MAKTIKKCTNCGGTGWVTKPLSDKKNLPVIVVCPVCNGVGNWEVDSDDDLAKG